MNVLRSVPICQKLDTANREVQEYLIGIACYWIREYGIDGWRLDVSDEVSHVFWRRFREAVKKKEKQMRSLSGRTWHDAYPYLRGDQYDSIMNYAFTKACLDYFARKTFDAKQMAEKLSSNLMRNMEPVNRMMLNLLDSHDTHRFLLLGSRGRIPTDCWRRLHWRWYSREHRALLRHGNLHAGRL